MLFTEFKEILRQLNYGNAVDKMETFLGKLDDLPDIFQEVGKHLRKHFVKLFTHLHYDGVTRTSNKCETLNSLPQIRRIKKILKLIGVYYVDYLALLNILFLFREHCKAEEINTFYSP